AHSHDNGFMQGGMHHAIAKGVTLDAKSDEKSHTIILRVGPMTLPANTSHMKIPQPADLVWTIPMSGWLLAYHPKLVDESGNSVYDLPPGPSKKVGSVAVKYSGILLGVGGHMHDYGQQLTLEAAAASAAKQSASSVPDPQPSPAKFAPTNKQIALLQARTDA